METNRVGKTTLVKLRARLYDPTEGQILLDGTDLREYDVDDPRPEIGRSSKITRVMTCLFVRTLDLARSRLLTTGSGFQRFSELMRGRMAGYR